MSAQDFAKFDAVLALDYELNCNYTDYNPFSNYEEWGGAIRNGNTIILAMEELRPLDYIDQESLDVIDAAAGYSLYDSNNTGAYISLGWMYHKCMGTGPTNATWLDTAFQVEEKDEQKFEIQKVADGRYNMVVSSHPALANLTNSTLKRHNKRASAKAAFTKYPSDFTPYAVAKSLNNKPFILLKESKNPLTGNPSFSPTNLPTLTPTASPTFLPSATPSKSASARLSARPSTASTKKIHCSDNADFYVNNDDSKTCQWIGSKASTILKFCVKEYVSINCPSICKMDCSSGSPSVAPTKLPTFPPTASPTSIPSATPSKSASARLSARPTTSSTKRPSIGYQHDLMPHCPDNADFYVNNDDSKTCQWIGSEASHLLKFCAKEYVANNCPSTCKMDCRSRSPSVAPTKLPTLTPTASPTSIPSATPSKSASARLSARPTTSSTKRPSIGYQHDLMPHCPDNADFYVNNDDSKTCQWIGSEASHLLKFCAKEYVANNCPSTCKMDCRSRSPSVAPTKLLTLTPSVTPSKSASVRLSSRPTTSFVERPPIGYQHDFMPHCTDNADFYTNGDRSKTCQWIGSKASRLRRFCVKQDVSIQCPATCEIECGAMDHFPMLVHFFNEVNVPLTDANDTTTAPSSVPKTSGPTDTKSTKSKKKGKASRKRVKKIAKNRKTKFMAAKKASKALKMEKKSKSSKS